MPDPEYGSDDWRIKVAEAQAKRDQWAAERLKAQAALVTAKTRNDMTDETRGFVFIGFFVMVIVLGITAGIAMNAYAGKIEKTKQLTACSKAGLQYIQNKSTLEWECTK